MSDKTILEDRLRGILVFLAKFEEPGFQFGSWVSERESETEAATSAYYAFGDEANAFINAAYEYGWVTPGFDWTEWQQTTEATRLMRDEGAIERADCEQLAHLLTLYIRADRFSEGTLASAYTSGILTRILRRARDILTQAQEKNQSSRPPSEHSPSR